MKHSTILIILILIILITGGAAAAILTSNKEDVKTGETFVGIFSNNFYNNVDSGEFGLGINIASKRWSNYINNDISIPIDYQTFDDPSSSILAYARMNNSNDITAGGTITINIGRNAPPAGWDDVIEHEIGHVLGLPGSNKWQNAIINNNGDTFLAANDFPLTAQAYYDLFPGVSGNIPLQSGGNHWHESTFTTELMTPNIGGENELITSRLTLTAMKEIGWDINLDQAEDF
jgi:hypothetical protein